MAETISIGVLVTRLRSFDRCLELVRAGEQSHRGARLVLRDAEQAATLLRRFALDGMHRLRWALHEAKPGRDVRRMSDGAVLDELGRDLAAGRLHVFHWKDALLPMFASGQSTTDDAPPPAPRQPPLTWVEIHLVDTDGDPVGGERFIIQLSDGSRYEDHLDDAGRARIDKIPKGQCKISFPDLDCTEWRPLDS